MALYENNSCPVCGKQFQPGDDIVTCPECGTPHHRACYRELGHCAHQALHGDGYAFTPADPPAEQKSSAPADDTHTAAPEQKKKCVACDAELDGDAVFCTHCGARQPGAGEKYRPPILQDTAPDPSQYPGTIEGEAAADVAAVVRTNTGYFLSRFRRNKKVGWNWKEKEKLILEQMRRYCNCVGMRHKDIFYLYIFPGKALEEGYEEWIIEITDAVCRELGEEHLPFAVGISRWKSDPQQYDTGLYEARIAVQGKTKPGISFFQYGEVITRKMMLSDILPEVLQLLMENKTQECMELVRSQTIAEKTELFKVQALEFILQLRAEVENLAGENEIRWNSRIFTQDFGKMSCADEVLKWTETHIEELGNVLTEKPYEESEYIRKVLHYIKGNFSKDLSLEDAGKEIGISSFYLSRLLKQERKTTFIETLTDIRLEAAVRMMKEGQLPMKEICCRSGYPNQSYFYRVVKKTTGMTVGVLRRYL